MAGVERLRIRYWLADRAAPVEADAVQDEWNKVVALDICVEARGTVSIRPETFIDCDGRVRREGKDYRRRAFWLRVARRNRATEPI